VRPDEIREFDVKALEEKVRDLSISLFNMRLQGRASKGPSRASDIVKTRKDIARIKTIIAEKTSQSKKTSIDVTEG
jgi:ribosomal protein L29